MKKILLAILAGLILVTAPFWGALVYGKIENRVMCWKVSDYVLENKGSIAVTEDHQSLFIRLREWFLLEWNTAIIMTRKTVWR